MNWLDISAKKTSVERQYEYSYFIKNYEHFPKKFLREIVDTNY